MKIKKIAAAFAALIMLCAIAVPIVAANAEDEITSIENNIDTEMNATITITWDARGGTVSPSSWNWIHGSFVPPLPTPFRSGRQFVGWFDTTAATGGTRITQGNFGPRANVTYFVRWNDIFRHAAWWWPAANAGMTTIPIFNQIGLTNIWGVRINSGIGSWNNVSASTRVLFQSGMFTNTATAGHRDWGSDRIVGMVTYFPDPFTPGRLAGFDIVLHTTNITNLATNIDVFARSVMAHELGHVIGLSDNPVGPGTNTIMSYFRDRNTMSSPTNFDIISVNMLYN